VTQALTAAAVAAMIEGTEAAAYADMFRAAPRSLGLDLRESRGVVSLRAARAPAMILNRTLGLGVECPAGRAHLRELIAWHSEAAPFAIQLSPAAQPHDMPGWLDAEGLVAGDAWTKVYRAADALPSLETDLRIDAVDAREAERFALVACEGFGMPSMLTPLMASTVGRPGWVHYMAWDHGAPAACAALFVHGAVGWLGIDATLPPMRRRGAQGALMARRMRDGARLGCRWFVTETGQERPERPNPSFRNMMRAGFTVAYHRPNYVPAARASGA
jgi:hypothetical protein